MPLNAQYELEPGQSYSFTYEGTGASWTTTGEYESRLALVSTIANPSFVYEGGTIFAALLPNRVRVSFDYVGGPGNTVESFSRELHDVLTSGGEHLSFIEANGGRAATAPTLSPTITKALWVGAAVVIAAVFVFGLGKGLAGGVVE